MKSCKTIKPTLGKRNFEPEGSPSSAKNDHPNKYRRVGACASNRRKLAEESCCGQKPQIVEDGNGYTEEPHPVHNPPTQRSKAETRVVEKIAPTVPAQTKLKPTIDEESDDTSSDDDSSSDSGSDISETESELAALEAADKRKYITFERGGFGPPRGPDGKFPSPPPRVPYTDTPVIPESRSRESSSETDQSEADEPESAKGYHETAEESEDQDSGCPCSSETHGPEQSPSSDNKSQARRSPIKREKKPRVFGSKVSEAELERMINELPEKNDPCFNRKPKKVYLPRHASYTPLIYDLETIGYTRQQTLWLFGADPEPMIPNVLWMRLKRYKASKNV